MDRRARVEDVDDEDGLQGTCAGKASSNSGNVSGRDKSASFVSPVLDPSLPTITASAAAAGFSDKGRDVSSLNGHSGFTGFNPAVGVNHVFTHLNNNGVPLQPYAVQSFPTFMTASNMAATHGLNVAATTVNGVDPTSLTGLSFLPSVPDATNGPMMHTYVPHNDVSGQAGIFYVQQPQQQQQQQQQQQAMYTTATGAPVSIATSTGPVMAYPQATSGQPVYIQQQPGVTYMTSGGTGGPPLVIVPGTGGPGGSYMFGSGGMGNFGGVCGPVHMEPAMGIGQTPNEVLQEQLEFAHANSLYEPQDFKPADDDKSRFYWMRELDGNWVQRSRATIDHLGCRWYITESGVFYAVRLPD
ncbi:hypothetical protein SEPCBS57363_004252 [Sporothrix epigloea]|uniref:Uncharacterized protein n=1 Tax=Sporothrix epigloea TaxID=1892477 RepID=A0ABP0DR16_9PEZI